MNEARIGGRTIVNPMSAPPGGPARAAGGLLGVVGGEAWRPPLGPMGTTEPGGPVASVMLGVCHSYVTYRGACVPVDVAIRHAGVSGPAWLVAVAIVRPNAPGLVADALELATSAGVPRHALGYCTMYVELAARLFAGWPVVEAIEAATRQPAPAPAPAPRLCGDAIVDGLTAGIWALRRTEAVAKILASLGGATTPAVRASAAGLLGLGRGVDALPAYWPRASRYAAECLAVAPALVRARHQHRQDPLWTGAQR